MDLNAKRQANFFREAQRKTRNSAFSWRRITINISMRIKEIVENRVTNYHMGLGRERPQDQRIMEKNRTRKARPNEQRLKDNIGYNVGMGQVGGQWANSRI